MRSGLFPSQQRALNQALKKADAFDHFRARTRRKFIALGLGGLTLAAAAFVMGRSLTPAEAAPEGTSKTSPILQTARTLAAEDDATLLAGAHTMLLGLDADASDPALRVGATRLARMVVSLPASEPRQRIARRILATIDRSGPGDMEPSLIERLRAHVK